MRRKSPEKKVGKLSGHSMGNDESRILTTLETAPPDTGSDDTGLLSLFTVNEDPDAEGTRVPPVVVLPVLLLFFKPSSANALLAIDGVEVRDFVKLNNGMDSKVRRVFEGVAVGRQSQPMVECMFETVGFIQYKHVAVVVEDVEVRTWVYILSSPEKTGKKSSRSRAVK